MLESKTLDRLLREELDAINTYRIAYANYWKGDQTERESLALKRSADVFVLARTATIAHALKS